jgi:hypothetical protein
LTIYPANEPEATQFPQFFRKDAIDLLVGTQELADETWQTIQREVNELVRAMNKLDVLGDPETVLCDGSELFEPAPL